LFKATITTTNKISKTNKKYDPSVDAVSSYHSLYEIDNNPESMLTLKHIEMLKNKKYSEIIHQLRDFRDDFSYKNYKNIFFIAASEFYLENHKTAYDLLKNFFINFEQFNSGISTEAELNLINLGYLYYKLISLELDLSFELNEKRIETEEPYNIIPKHFNDIELYSILKATVEPFSYTAVELYFTLIVQTDFNKIIKAMPTKNQIDLSVIGKNKIKTVTDDNLNIFKYLIYNELLTIYNKFCNKLVLSTFDTAFLYLDNSITFHFYKANALFNYGYYEEALVETHYILNKGFLGAEDTKQETLALQTLIKQRMKEKSLYKTNTFKLNKF
jgi:hypothetical protein